MNSADVRTLVDTVVTDIDTAGDFAGMIDPALIPFIQLGKAVDKMLPGIAQHVTDWIDGTPPTEEEKAEFVAKNAVLGDPNAP